MKLKFYFIPLIKVNSKWNKDVNMRPETIKFLEENRLFDIGLDNDFLAIDQKHQQQTQK